MYYSWTGQWVVNHIGTKLFPRKRPVLAATIQPLHDRSNRYIAKSHYHSRIAAYAVVVVMSSKFRRQNWPDFFNTHNVANSPKQVVHRFARFAELTARRLTAQQKLAFTAQTAEMCKSQKVECVGLAALTSGVLSFVPTKTNRPGLFRVKTQSEFRKSLSKHRLDYSGALPVLNHADKIVSIADQITLPVYARFDSFDKPQIQYIM